MSREMSLNDVNIIETTQEQKQILRSAINAHKRHSHEYEAQPIKKQIVSKCMKYAMQYIELGYKIAPIQVYGKSMKSEEPDKVQKGLVAPKPYRINEMPNGDENGFYIMTGEEAGITIVDLDNRINELSPAQSEFLDTCLSEGGFAYELTCNGGIHIIGRYTSILKNNTSGNTKTDVLNGKSQCIGAGCNFYYNNTQYEYKHVSITKSEDGEYSWTELEQAVYPERDFNSVLEFIRDIRNTLISCHKPRSFPPLFNFNSSAMQPSSPATATTSNVATSKGIINGCGIYENFQFEVVTSENGFTLVALNFQCTCDITHIHSSSKHSCIYLNKGKNGVVYGKPSCFSHKYDGNLEASLTKQLWKLVQPQNTELELDENEISYEDLKAKFEENNFKVDTVFMNTEYEHRSYKMSDFSIKHCELKYTAIKTDSEGQQYKKDEKFLKRWYEDENKKRFDRVVFKPNQEVKPNEYNKFHGFHVVNNYQPYDIDQRLEYVEPIISFIRDTFCSGHVELYQYVLKWMANIFQNPENPSRVALVVRGEEGCGKGSFSRILRKMIGDEHSTESTKTNFFTPHSTLMDSKLFLHLDEFNTSGNADHINELKNRITEENITLNPKGLPIYSINNFCNFLICSNDLTPVQRDGDSRRFCCIKVSEEHKGDYPYWENFNKALNDQVVLSAFYDYLMDEVNVEGFHFQTNMVKTEEQENYTIPPFYLWLSQVFYETFYDEHGMFEQGATYLMKNYISFLQSGNYKNDNINATSFGKLMKNCDKAITVVKTRACNMYRVDRVELEAFLKKRKAL